MRISTCVTMAAAAGAGLMLAQPALASEAAQPNSAPAAPAISEQTRAELLAARDTAWRSFFSDAPVDLEALLGPELIAIQQSHDAWEGRDRLLAMAGAIRKYGVKIGRLEFPRTEIQLFGDVAILYYSYIFETTDGKRSVTDAGRGTEVFVRRGGRWVDVGWHLDNGAFARKAGAWQRVSPDPDAPKPAAP